MVATRAPSDPAREAWAAIADLFFGDEGHDRFHDAGDAVELSPPALKALLSLDPGEAKPMRVLAGQWRCDASWVTSLADTLEERGFVERRILPADRRVKTIVLTDAGAKAKERALERLHQPPAAIAALSATEQRQLRDLLRKVADPPA